MTGSLPRRFQSRRADEPESARPASEAAGLPAAARVARSLGRVLSRCAVLLPLAAVGGCSLLEAVTACTPVTSKHGPDDYIGSLYYGRHTLMVSGRQIETYVYLNLGDVETILRREWLGKSFKNEKSLVDFSDRYFLNCFPNESSSINFLRKKGYEKYMNGDMVCLYGGMRDSPQYWLSECVHNAFVLWINTNKQSDESYKIESIYIFVYHDERIADLGLF